MKAPIFLILTLLFSAGFAGHAFSDDHDRDPFKALYDDHVQKVQPGDSIPFTVKMVVPKGHYLYDEKTSVLLDHLQGIVLMGSERPKASPHFDPFLKKEAPVYFNDFEIVTKLRVPAGLKPGRLTLEGEIRYQGCSEDFCYRPVKKTVLLPIEVVAPQAAISAPPEKRAAVTPVAPSVDQASPGFWQTLKEGNPEKLLNLGKVPLLGGALLAGIATSFTPCVLPIVPLTLAFVGVKKRRRGNIIRAAALVLGMVTMYSVLGFLAATLGLQLGFLFQSRWFVLITALFFVLFALGLFEVIPFHLPSKWHQRLVRMGGEGPRGAFVAGMTIGLIASPCVGPLMAPLLLIAARSQDRFYGFILLFIYGLGMGLLFLLLGSVFAEFGAKLKSGKWTHWMKRALGVLMILPAIYYGNAFAAPYFNKASSGGTWSLDFERGLAEAKQSNKPILLDFYANWCGPCQELDHLTFSTPEFKRKAKEFVTIKVDCSDDDAQCKKATDRYDVVGMPTVLFLKSDGSRIPDVQLVGGFANSGEMLVLMQHALDASR